MENLDTKIEELKQLELQAKNKIPFTYLVDNIETLAKVCNNSVTTFEWNMHDSTKLKFEKMFNKSWWNKNWWILETVNDRNTLWPGDLKEIQFSMYKQKIKLDNLYPFVPKVTGVDILQVVASLAYICHKKLDIYDASTLRRPYTFLYGVAYYDMMLKNITKIEKYAEKIPMNFEKSMPILKERTLNLINPERMWSIKEICLNKNISAIDCPFGYKWLGEILYGGRTDPKTGVYFPSALQEYFNDTCPHGDFASNTIMFNSYIDEKYLKNILDKPSPGERNTYCNFTFEEKCAYMLDYDKIEFKIGTKPELNQFMSDIFDECTEIMMHEKMYLGDWTNEKLFKIFIRGCVEKRFDFKLKYDCSKKFDRRLISERTIIKEIRRTETQEHKLWIISVFIFIILVFIFCMKIYRHFCK